MMYVFYILLFALSANAAQQDLVHLEVLAYPQSVKRLQVFEIRAKLTNGTPNYIELFPIGCGDPIAASPEPEWIRLAQSHPKRIEPGCFKNVPIQTILGPGQWLEFSQGLYAAPEAPSGKYAFTLVMSLKSGLENSRLKAIPTEIEIQEGQFYGDWESMIKLGRVMTPGFDEKTERKFRDKLTAGRFHSLWKDCLELPGGHPDRNFPEECVRAKKAIWLVSRKAYTQGYILETMHPENITEIKKKYRLAMECGVSGEKYREQAVGRLKALDPDFKPARKGANRLDRECVQK